LSKIVGFEGEFVRLDGVTPASEDELVGDRPSRDERIPTQRVFVSFIYHFLIDLDDSRNALFRTSRFKENGAKILSRNCFRNKVLAHKKWHPHPSPLP
jgi:hypothetical protein